MSVYSGVGWWEHLKRPLPTRCKSHETVWVPEERGEQSPPTVHHRPVDDDQHELPSQTDPGGVQCPWNLSQIRGHGVCHGEELKERRIHFEKRILGDVTHSGT